MKSILYSVFALSVFVSCSKKSDPEPPITIDTQSIDLKYDKDHQFTLKKGNDAVDASTFEWKINDSKVATISTSGLLNARKVGESSLIATSKDGKTTLESKIIISPYSTLFKEPIVEWGTAAAFIKSSEKRSVFNESATGVIFSGENTSIRYVMYLLENGRLKSAAVLFTPTTAIATEAVTFLKERYPVHGLVDGDKAGFISDDEKYAMMTGVDATLGLYTLYFPYDKDGKVNGAAKDNAIDSFRSLLPSK